MTDGQLTGLLADVTLAPVFQGPTHPGVSELRAGGADFADLGGRERQLRPLRVSAEDTKV